MLAIFFSASEYAYNMLKIFQKFQPQYAYSCYAYKKGVVSESARIIREEIKIVTYRMSWPLTPKDL